MSKNWREAYSKLKDFIAKHSEIEIEPTRVSLPDDFRPEFYRLFDSARGAFLEDKLPNLLEESSVLSQNYLKVEHEVIRLLGLDDLSMETELQRYLHDPKEQLTKGLFDPLFDILKGRVDIEEFERTAWLRIQSYFGHLRGRGYEKWVTISLIKLLNPDKVFQVSIRELDGKDLHQAKGHALIEEPPAPEESRRLSFKYQSDAEFTTPDFIVHSARADGYVAMRSEIMAALGIATNASKKREWYALDLLGTLDPGMTLIYVDSVPEDISLVADAERICRPDVIIESQTHKDWYEKEGLEKVKSHHVILKPKLGTYIVARDPIPEQAFVRLGEGVHFLNVGFDQPKLGPIVSVLTPT